MNEELRAKLAAALSGAGMAGFKDTTTSIRPKWRASFSFRGEIDGETSYVHVYVPDHADELQVNCSAPAPALNPVSPHQLHDELAQFNAAHAPGSAGWDRVLGELGAGPGSAAGWQAATKPYVGMQHRMVLARVTLPLDSLAPASVGLAIRLGVRLATTARELVTGSLAPSPDDE
ncbi:MAG TPA: hypothetical protein VF960_12830 [Chloroflexota bacterium]